MEDERLTNPSEQLTIGLTEFLDAAANQTWPASQEALQGPASYRLALGKQPIQLGNVEFRILLYLASRHYHAFTRSAIAEAVSTDEQPVAEAEVDEHVAALRDQLGVFHDYVQTVPGIGYRFKA
jgi:DNA-binding response OmpR family regulator